MLRWLRRAAFIGYTALSASALAPEAVAQPGAARTARAQQLFREGRKLMEEGRVAEACPKFEQSDRMDAAVGTVLNLASCYERSARLASAWATYGRAAALARDRGQTERERHARASAAELEPRLSRLTVVVSPEARLEGLELKRDGIVLPAELFGQSLPVDSGSRVIEASAPGRVRWSKEVEVTGEAASVTITVPVLTRAAPEVTSAAPTGAEDATSRPPAAGAPAGVHAPRDQGAVGRRGSVIPAVVVGGLGGLSLVTSGVMALLAARANERSKDHCTDADENLCSARGVELRDQARGHGNVASVTFGIGAAGLAGGGLLYALRPRRSRTARGVERTPQVGLGAGGVELKGQF